ncbi:MAG TPA: Gldg family protein [bacterium]|mgnify:FL=1|nr:Gldg family protein [bacterium]
MRRLQATISTAALLISLLAVNYLAARNPARWDLTSDKLYTLSKSTNEILNKLDDTVTVRMYFTSSIPPSLEPLRRGIEDILSEFKTAAHGKIKIEFIDPNTSATEEQKAALLGIPPVQLNVIEKDKQEVAKIYLGMAVMYKGRQQVIPVVRNVQNMEYDLTEAILKVSSENMPKVAWFEKTADSKSSFQLVKASLGRRYEVLDITDKNIGELDAKDFGVLVLASPPDFSKNEIAAIDGYLMDGGKIIAMIDRFIIGTDMGLEPFKSSAVDMLSHYGIDVDNSLVVDHSNATAAFTGGPVTYHLPYPYWVEVRADQFDPESPIVSELQSVVLPWTSPLSISGAEEEGEDRILAYSSQFSTAVPADEIKTDPKTAGEFLLNGKKESMPLIALLKGPFGSFIKTMIKGTPAESPPASAIFAIGTSRWIDDAFLENFPQNAAIFENAVDAFVMGELLIGIRSRFNTSRPIAIMPEGAPAVFKFLNLAIGPAIMITIGTVVWIFRKRKFSNLKRKYSK